MLNRTLLGACLLALVAVPGEARADVDCGPDIVPQVVLPISASFHLGSLLPVSIGLGTSRGREAGWRNATYISSSLNIASSVAVLALDKAELGGCDRDMHPATIVTESLFMAWSSSLLIATVLYDTTDRESQAVPVSAYVVPVREGALAGVGFAF
jgi:hypothetical protein